MVQKRLPVRDLEAPERIQPAPVQSSTFAEAAKPPMDDSLEALQKGLAAFASGAHALGAKHKAEEEKRLKIEQLGAWEEWKASKSSDEQLDAIRSGKFPMPVDRILDTVVTKEGAALEARKIAEEADAKLEGRLGLSTFNADEYVREIAAPYVARIRKDPRAMAYLGDHLDRIRSGVQKRHEEVRGQLNTQFLENTGKIQIRGAVMDGITREMTDQQIMDGLRHPDPKIGVLAATGPRKKGGSLDLSYGKQDDLLIDVIEELAADPSTARRAEGLLQAQRKTVEGGVDLGPLASSVRHSAKVEAIRKKALKTLGDHAEVSIKDNVRGMNALAIDGQSTAFNQISDIEIRNPEDPSRIITYSAEKQKEEATRAWLAITRQRKGVIDAAAEVEHLQGVGVMHPEYKDAFNGAYAGVMNNLANPKGPSQVDQIVKWGDQYMAIAELNPAMADKLVNKDAKEFLDTYRVLRYMGRDPQQAATETAIAFGQGGVARDPNVIAGQTRKIEDTIRAQDFNGWWPKGGAINQGNVKDQLLPMAKAIARTQGVSAEEAIERAGKLMVERAPLVNGRVVLAPFLKKDDADYVQPLLDAIHKKYAGPLKAADIPNSKHLSLAPWGQHKFVVVKWDGGAVTVPEGYDHDGQPLPGRVPLVIEHGDIAKSREITGIIKKRDGEKALEDGQRPLAPQEATPSGMTPTQRVIESLRSQGTKEPIPLTVPRAPQVRETPEQRQARQQKRQDDDRRAIESRD